MQHSQQTKNDENFVFMALYLADNSATDTLILIGY